MTRYKILKIFLITAALQIYSSPILAGDNAIKVPKDTTIFTLVRGEVETRLKVPPVYIDRDATEGTDQGAYLHLKMSWPSMEATSIRTFKYNEREYEEYQQALKTGHFLRIQLGQAKQDWIGNYIKNNLKKDWVPVVDAKLIPGFKQYTSKTEDYAIKRHWLASVILVPLDEAYSKRVYITCPFNSNLSSVGLYCTEHTSLDHYVQGNFTFSLSHLQDWKHIDSDVRQLFNQMYQPQ